MNPDNERPRRGPARCGSANENSGTSSSKPAVTSSRPSRLAAAQRRPSSTRSSISTNSGKLAKPSRPIATLATWIAAKNATQCSASDAPLPTRRRSNGGAPRVRNARARARAPPRRRRAAEHDRQRRQVEPFAEQPRKAEQQHGAVQRRTSAIAVRRGKWVGERRSAAHPRRRSRSSAAVAPDAAALELPPAARPHHETDIPGGPTMPTPISVAKAIAAVRKAPGTRVKVAVADIDGVLRGKYLHKEKFYSAVEGGFGFCDVVFGWDMMDVTLRQHDAHRLAQGLSRRARADRPRHACARCRGTTTCHSSSAISSSQKGGREAPLPICPRQVLKRVLKRAEKLGVIADVRHGVRVVQLPRDAADRGPTSRASRRRRSRRACSAIRCCAPTRTARSSRRCSTRWPRSACRSKACTPRPVPASTRRRSCSRKRWSRRTARSCSRRARRKSASRFGIMPSFMAKWSKDYPGLLRPLPHVAVRRQEEPVPRRQAAGTA